MGVKDALTQLEIIATNMVGRLAESKDERERKVISKQIEAIDMGKDALKTEIDLVRCKDCKHYDTESRTFPCCTDIFGAVRYMEADGFCSKGERRADEHTD